MTRSASSPHRRVSFTEAPKRFPLPDDERRALVKASLLSEAIIVAIGVVAAIVLHGLQTGDWLGALAFGWLEDMRATLFPHPIMIVLPVIMVAIVGGIDLGGKRWSASYRAARAGLVHDINGELPRIRYSDMVLCMSLAGICEEFCFRFGLLGILLFLFALILPGPAAAVLAVIVSSVLFWAIHIQYRDPWSIALALSGGLLLGAGYVISGSLLSVMVAHAVYNFAILLVEQHLMMNDPDYFAGGEAPTSIIIDQEKAAKQDDSPSDTEDTDPFSPNDLR